MTQTEMFNERGEFLKTEGISVVTEHNPAWVECAVNEIKRLVALNGEVSADDLRTLPPPPHANAVGAAFNAAARAGLIVRDGFRKATTPSCHGRFVSVWRAM